MSDVAQYLACIISGIVEEPEEVDIEEITGHISIILKLTVGKNDVGRIYGKRGNTLKALQTILKSLGAKIGKHIQLEITNP